MYELSCPACQKVRRFAFLRVGARSVCPDCSHPFIIKKDHFKRNVTSVLAEVPAGERDPLTAVGAATPPPPTNAAAGSVGLASQALASLASAASKTASAVRPAAEHVTAGSPTATSTQAPASTIKAPAADTARASSNDKGEVSVPITAVPTAQVAGKAVAGPVSKLIATRIRQKRRKKMLALLTLVIVLLLFGVIATLLIGLNRQPVDEVVTTTNQPGPVATIIAPQTISLFKVGPAQWEMLDEPAYPIAHLGPLKLEDYGLVSQSNSDDSMIVGSVTCTGFDVYPNARLELLLLDSENQIFAKAQLALLPTTNLREAARQNIRMSVPAELGSRISTIDWEIISGQPLNDGALLAPTRIVRQSQGRDTQLQLTFENTLPTAIHKLHLSIRAVDHRGKPLAHWAGLWEGHLDAQQSLMLQVATPMTDSTPASDWHVHAAAELALQPLISIPDEDPYSP